MELISVNVGLSRTLQYGDQTVVTSIFKEPVAGRVLLRALNLDGDRQSDLYNHGGTYQAAYAYSHDHYAYWQHELGRTDLVLGQFGENFTVAGMTEDQVYIGDVYRIGAAVVQVTQPRTPCYKLALRMNMLEFPKLFLASGRVGFYLRVLEEGEVGAGDTIEAISRDPAQLTIREVSNLLHFERDNLAGAERAYQVETLSPDWRAAFAKRIRARR